MMRPLLTRAAGWVLATALVLVSSCATTFHRTLDQEVAATLTAFEVKNPTLPKLLERAAGYVVFPTVGRVHPKKGVRKDIGVLFVDGEPVEQIELTQVREPGPIRGALYGEIVVLLDQSLVGTLRVDGLAVPNAGNDVGAHVSTAAIAAAESGIVVFTTERDSLLQTESVLGQRLAVAKD